MAGETIPRRELAVLGAILLLAIVLRIFGLNTPLWYDEIISLETHLRLPWSEMLRSYSMNNHYLYDYQAKAVIEVFGVSPWTLRLPALVFGVASIGACWVLARHIAGPAVAHISALLLSLSYHHIWFSQNARGYTELSFWAMLGMILFLKGIAAPGPRIWIAYGVTLSLAVFTHLTGAFFFAAQGLVWLVVLALQARRGNLGRELLVWPAVGFVVGGVLTLLFYLPILPSLAGVIGGVAATSAVDVMQEYQNPLWTVIEAVRTTIGATGALALVAGAGIVVLATLGAAFTPRPAPLFGLIIAVHIALSMVILLAIGMRLWPRFFFLDIGLLLILIVLGVRLICGVIARMFSARITWAIFPAAVGAMIALSALLAARNYTAPKQNLAAAFALVEADRTTTQRVLAIGYASAAFIDHFRADWQPIFTEDEYQAALQFPGPVTIVVAFPRRNFRVIPSLRADAQDRLTLLRRFPGTLGDGAVLVYRRD